MLLYTWAFVVFNCNPVFMSTVKDANCFGCFGLGKNVDVHLEFFL